MIRKASIGSDIRDIGIIFWFFLRGVFVFFLFFVVC